MSTKKKLSAPVLYFGRIIGLIPFRLGEDQSDLQFSIAGAVYGTVLAIAYSIASAMALRLLFLNGFPLDTPLLVIASGMEMVCIYFLCVAIWLTFAYRQEHIIKMLRDFFKIHEIVWEYFEIPTDYERIIYQITVHATWINVFLLILNIIAYSFFAGDRTYNVVIWISYCLPGVVYHNVIILFLVSMSAIRRKIRRLNEKLIERGRSINSSTSINDFAFVHGFLCDLAESVSHFFSHFILQTVVQHLLLLLTRIYGICILLKNQKSSINIPLAMYVNVTDVIVCILQEYFIGSIVDGTVKEARNTGNALHEMANKQRPLRQRTQVYAFSIQLLRRRLDLSAYGFFKFDLSLVSKVIGTATTYIVIVMQLENFNPNVPSALPN
ncbi:Gustatory receptor 14 [Cephus cinctus]|uniref:Gustatory receptor n=1 Tax=Cephus cinctus TaxID=211228 RepID=A0A3L9LSW0_CEPCN|nr:putative gustatory receptor 28b [Cephus cinctus]XP_024941649.1 putative gustatory receptor 28b [Cephus cinctus]RLZ02214.1 Gustatory receptor 14 [Cephus cinctus]